MAPSVMEHNLCSASEIGRAPFRSRPLGQGTTRRQDRLLRRRARGNVFASGRAKSTEGHISAKWVLSDRELAKRRLALRSRGRLRVRHS